VTDQSDQPQRFEAVCPHCRKPFTAELLAQPSARHRGFKCPHCKLFVPESRAEESRADDAPLSRARS
jgi:DNA-directed RNA polymerase subunit RPC12/RpoP